MIAIVLLHTLATASGSKEACDASGDNASSRITNRSSYSIVTPETPTAAPNPAEAIRQQQQRLPQRQRHLPVGISAAELFSTVGKRGLYYASSRTYQIR